MRTKIKCVEVRVKTGKENGCGTQMGSVWQE